MRALVTGGAGFIGSHVADALIAAGHTVTIVDDLSTGFRENLPAQAEFHHLDIRDEGVAGLFWTNHFEAVFHLAAQMDVRRSVRDPLDDMQINIAGSLRLLELCRHHKVDRFIFASTGGAIYGEQEVFPAAEDHPARPLSPYGVAKLSIERYLYFYHHEFGLNGVALRYANVYGPRQNPHGEAGVVAIFCGKMIAGEQAYIWGDGLQTRDYVYVSDIARANIAMPALNGFHIINLGTGIETDVVTLFETINGLAGSRCRREHKPPAPGEQRRSSIDAGLANNLLGWEPKVGLDEGLAQTVEYFRRKQAASLAGR